MPTDTIDLNADVGESYGNWSMGDDAAMLDVVTSANIACGFHAGDPLTIRRTVRLAADRGVTIGAHVSYPDLVGFGRRTIEIEPDALEADVLYQLCALAGICRTSGTSVRYVKAHGALYHRTATDPVQAEALVQALLAFDPRLPILCSGRGVIGDVARAHGVVVIDECFADRAYRPDGTLVPRAEPGAVHHDPSVVAAQALALRDTGRFGSICLHGDTPGAVLHARAVRDALIGADTRIVPFVADPAPAPRVP